MSLSLSPFDTSLIVTYSSHIVEVLQTDEFNRWLRKLKDHTAKVRISERLERVELGNFGDHKSLGGGLSEFRMPYGPGYRLYYSHQGDTIIVLLAGGDKSSQARDIEKARDILKGLNQ